MKKIMTILMLAAFMIVLNAVGVFAAVPNGTQFTVNNQDAAFTADSVSSTNSVGGNVTNMSINQTTQTNNWHAFYGDVIGNIVLQSGAYQIYDWGSSDLGGWVFFSNDSSVDWSSVSAGGQADVNIDQQSLSQNGSNDRLNLTMTGTITHPAINDVGAGGIVANTAFGVETLSNGGTAWDTVILTESLGAHSPVIYAGGIQQDNQNYNGNQTDYQVILPVHNNTDTRTYFVWAGLE